VHHEFVPPGRSVTGYFLAKDFAVVARYSSEEAARQVAGALSLPSSSSCHLQPTDSQDLAPRNVWLFLALKMGLKKKRFATMENSDGRTPEDSKRSLQTMAGSTEQVCVRACKGPTLKVIK
jgi:hypothetical protein